MSCLGKKRPFVLLPGAILNDMAELSIPIGEVRAHGSEPFAAAVLHGGPGAPGSAHALAQGLHSRLVAHNAQRCGVLEPMQAGMNVDEQVLELVSQLNGHAPLCVVGWSWGALLGILLAAQHPERVRSLVLVGCPPLEAGYARSIMPTRMGRLNDEERELVGETMRLLEQGQADDVLLSRFGRLMTKADSVDLFAMPEAVSSDMEQHMAVWSGAAELRSSGRLLRLAKSVHCPVIALHGDHDPHPGAGVAAPLVSMKNFWFHSLSGCGHTPWLERRAHQRFFELLIEAVSAE